ncbi:MAG: 50S ribosomal protein L25 [Bryobacteraceae bacterium]
MKTDVVVSAVVRDSRGKNEARRLRKSGKVPAIVYGAGGKAIALSVEPKSVVKILHSKTGHNTIFDLSIENGETTPVMLVDWQFDPIKETLLHVDLNRIDLTKRLRVSIPVLMAGEAKGVKQEGGLLEVVTREIEIECLPSDIPESFTVDVSELMMNQSIRAADIQMPESLQMVTLPDAVIAHVVAIREEVEEKPAEGVEAVEVAPAAEPEVIKKGKKEEAEEESK